MVRCVFVIDPKGVLRLMLYYPLTTGSNMQEILCIIEALQVSDEKAIATPANWMPGNQVIVPPPQTQQDAEVRVELGLVGELDGQYWLTELGRSNF